MNIFEYMNPSEELNDLLTNAVVYRLTDDEHLPPMLRVRGDFILKDVEHYLSFEDTWGTHIKPILRTLATLCGGPRNILCCDPGITSQSHPGDPVGYSQKLFTSGLMPVLMRAEYEPMCAGTLFTISIMIGFDE
jgi:hypothetical protein